MSREQEVIEYKVGLFVLSGLIILSICVALLGGESSMFTRYYDLTLKMREIQGVQNGTIVSLAGIKVGNVTGIRFLPEQNVLELQLRINEDYQERIRTNALASLKTKGVLGDQFIYINPGSHDHPVLQPGQELRLDPAGDLLGRLSKRGGELEAVFEILQELKVLMARVNGDQRSDMMMSNLVEASDSLKQTLAESQKLLLDIRQQLPQNENLKATIDHLASILEKIDTGDGTLASLINDPRLYQRLTNLIGGSTRQQYFKSLIRESIQVNEQANPGSENSPGEPSSTTVN